MSMELKNRIKLGMGLLLVIAVGLAFYFGFFAARAPAEIPDLAEHTGTVTVTHGNALLDARMDEADSAKLIELLAHARFSPNVRPRSRITAAASAFCLRTAGRSPCSGARKRSLPGR